MLPLVLINLSIADNKDIGGYYSLLGKRLLIKNRYGGETMFDISVTDVIKYTALRLSILIVFVLLALALTSIPAF